MLIWILSILEVIAAAIALLAGYVLVASVIEPGITAPALGAAAATAAAMAVIPYCFVRIVGGALLRRPLPRD